MVNVKSYKDGDRFILVVENCTGDLAKKVNRFLSEIIGVSEEATPVPALKPIETEKQETPSFQCAVQASPGDFKELPTQAEITQFVLEKGTYAGETVDSALKTYGINAAIDIACCAQDIPKDYRKEIVRKCKSVIFANIQHRDARTDSLQTIIAFFKQYYPLISKGVEQILATAGYATLKEFFEFADEDMQRDAYEGTIQSLMERVS